MSEADMKRKHAVTGEYFDLCSRCLSEVAKIIELPVNGDLLVVEQGEEYIDEGE
jgi:hypothetical protein